MIRKATLEDVPQLVSLAIQMWKSHTVEDLTKIFCEHIKKRLCERIVRRMSELGKGSGDLEYVSDCELDNEDSLKFHLKMGFAEANRIICFTKRLTDLEE